MSHTPGPWTVVYDCGAKYLKSATGDPLMCNQRYYPWTPDNDSDWTLIAAAPDMLEALRNAMNCIDPKDSPRHEYAYVAAQHIIAQATGAV